MAGIGLPLMAQLKDRMHWLQARQKVLAQNVANADTPGFKPRDLRAQPRGAGPSRCAPPAGRRGRRAGAGGANEPRPHRCLDRPGDAGQRAGRRFETVPTGNAVTLEEEMLKLAETQMDYQTAASLYSKSLSLLKIAIGKRA